MNIFNLSRTEEYVSNRTRFFEIYETSPRINNLSLHIKLTRLFVRYSTRIFGFYIAAKLLGLLLKSFNFYNNKDSKTYIEYILAINKFNIEYLLHLSNNQMTEAVYKKNQWGEYILKFSTSGLSRWSARNYLSLLSRHGFHTFEHKSCDLVIDKKLAKRHSELKFYIYGPNAVSLPNEIYEDHIIVFLKPIDYDLSKFKKSILFLNGVYYRTKILRDNFLKKSITEKYSQIIVSCRTSPIDIPFERARFPIGDTIASPMALGRLLYNLVLQYGTFNCVIEGFDFYLDKKMYASYYPSMSIDKEQEQLICSGLAAHDPLYNFLYSKELTEILDIADSDSFKSLIEMSSKSYLEELSKIRNFNTLRQQ